MTLVPLSRTSCPDCAAPLTQLVVWQAAILRHAGYGATRRSVVRRCGQCGWHLESEQTETTPRCDRCEGRGWIAVDDPLFPALIDARCPECSTSERHRAL